jgi:tRNA threonylcarbamoyladenosine biosynthesis protein TsaE
MVRRLETASAAETAALGARLAAELDPGDVVLIKGELGAGKTTFVRGACGALGVTAPVTSPTFTIGQRYHGSVDISHVDLYRVEALDQEDPALLVDYLRPDAVTFVEWPPADERALSELTRVTWRVELHHAGGDRRHVEISHASP